jgi:hypothetical protein
MAVTKLNYVPGASETLTNEPLDDLPVLNTWYYFAIDGWSHVMSDIVLKQSGSPIPGTAYELTIDDKYTDLEADESGKTLYAMWRIVDGTYDLIATTLSGSNFGTYVDNERVQAKLDLIQPDLAYGRIKQIEWTTNTTITVSAGLVLIIEGLYYILASNTIVTRNRATVSEGEHLYAYESGGALAFEFDPTAAPVFDTTLGYWIKTGDDTRRYIMTCVKDGSGNFLDFHVWGVGANKLNCVLDSPVTIVDAALNTATLRQVDVSLYVPLDELVCALGMYWYGQRAAAGRIATNWYRTNSTSSDQFYYHIQNGGSESGQYSWIRCDVNDPWFYNFSGVTLTTCQNFFNAWESRF